MTLYSIFFKQRLKRADHDSTPPKNILISVYHKDGLAELMPALSTLEVNIYSTGGTAQTIRSLGYSVRLIEDLTGFPALLDGRVKTLHPKVFGGILARRNTRLT